MLTAPEPIVLVIQGTDDIAGYACPKCHMFWGQSAASAANCCHRICDRCKESLAERGYTVCKPCLALCDAERDRAELKRQLAACAFLHPESPEAVGPLHADGDPYYRDLDSAFDEYDDGLPALLWVAEVTHPRVNADSVLENTLEGLDFIDCDDIGFDHEDEFRAFVEQWNAKQTYEIWNPTFRQAVVLDTDRLRALLTDLGLPERCADVPEGIGYNRCQGCDCWTPRTETDLGGMCGGCGTMRDLTMDNRNGRDS